MLLRFGSALSSFCSTKSLAFWQQPAAGGAFKSIFWPIPGLTFDSRRWDLKFFIHGTRWDSTKNNNNKNCIISPWGKYVSNLVFYTHHHGRVFQCQLWCQNLQQGSARLQHYFWEQQRPWGVASSEHHCFMLSILALIYPYVVDWAQSTDWLSSISRTKQTKRGMGSAPANVLDVKWAATQPGRPGVHRSQAFSLDGGWSSSS